MQKRDFFVICIVVVRRLVLPLFSVDRMPYAYPARSPIFSRALAALLYTYKEMCAITLDTTIFVWG